MCKDMHYTITKGTVNLDLTAYLQKINFLSINDCQNIIYHLNNTNNWREYPYSSPKDNICVQENPDIPYYDCRLPKEAPISKNIQEKTKTVVDNYINEFLSDLPWFSYWNGNSKAHYIKYPTGSGMDIHCDHVSNQFDGEQRGIPILTLLALLNDDFTGGELQFWQNQQFKLAAGEAVIFPSNFLFPHKVNKVISGIRYSFVVWIW